MIEEVNYYYNSICGFQKKSPISTNNKNLQILIVVFCFGWNNRKRAKQM